MNHCRSCEAPYEWRKSTSRWLKFQFCSATCEIRENGATIEEMLAVERNYTVLALVHAVDDWRREREWEMGHPLCEAAL